MKTGTKLALAGLVLAIACMALWNGAIRDVDIPANRTLFVIGFLSAAGLGIASYVRSPSWPGRLIALPAIAIGLLVPFTISISEQAVAEGGIQVGDPLPVFASVDDQGKPFDSETLQGHPVLIKFFRAHW